MKDNIRQQSFQTDFNDKIRRRCRVAVDRFGGLRKFANTIGEDEDKWFNRFTDGRVVGFDTEWLYKVLEVTGDYEVLIPFFERGGRIRMGPLMQICKVLNHVVLPVFNARDTRGTQDTQDIQAIRDIKDDTTNILVSYLLKAGQKLLSRREE